MDSLLGSEAITEHVTEAIRQVERQVHCQPHRVEMDSLLGRSAAAIAGARRRAR